MSYRALDPRRVVGLSANKESKEKRSKGARGEAGGDAEGIKRDIGNIKYKCNLPRFMSVEEERRERRREEEEEEEVDEGLRRREGGKG